MSRYIGRVNKLGAGKPYGFIAIESVRNEDGSPAALDTKEDIFIHQGDCDSGLRVGMEVNFHAERDRVRGGNTLKAWSVKETPGSRLVLLEQGGIQLMVEGASKDGALEEASVFATWCISNELAAEIKARRLRGFQTQLLLVHWPVASKYETEYHSVSSETRHLVDVTDPMVSLMFSASGKHRVVALLVFASTVSDLRDTYLKKRDGKYATDVISSSGVGTVLNETGSGCIELHMPEGPLAKQPFDWEWVNRYFKHYPSDQCSYRWRRVPAYTVQPFWVVIVWLFRQLGNILKVFGVLLVLVALLLVGVFKINYRVLKQHPRFMSAFDLVDEQTMSNRFTSKRTGKENVFPIIFTPFAFAIASLIGGMFQLPAILEKGVTTFSWWPLLIVYGFMFAFWTAIYVKASRDEREKEEDVKARRQAELEATLNAQLRGITCSVTPERNLNVWRLPLRPKNIPFFYAGAKRWVCRPFEQR